MAADYENLSDLSHLSDRELRDVIAARLREHNGLDADYITVKVAGGRVTLDGQVGTDVERRVAEHVVTDTLGLRDVRNDIVVTTLHRAESPQDVEEHLVDEERTEGLLLGDRPVPLNPESEHVAEDLDARLWGTSDVGRAIADGTAWIPPEAPTPEGLDGTEGPGENR